MKYLKSFIDTSAYEMYKNGDKFILPNVSWVKNSMIVYYNPTSNEPVTPELSTMEDGYIYLTFESVSENQEFVIADNGYIDEIYVTDNNNTYNTYTNDWDAVAFIAPHPGPYQVKMKLNDNNTDLPFKYFDNAETIIFNKCNLINIETAGYFLASLSFKDIIFNECKFPNLTSMEYMLENASGNSFTCINCDFPNLTMMDYMFSYSNISNIKFKDCNLSNLESLVGCFQVSGLDNFIFNEIFENCNITNLKNLSNTFFGTNVKVIDFTGVDLSQVMSISSMIYEMGHDTSELRISSPLHPDVDTGFMWGTEGGWPYPGIFYYNAENDYRKLLYHIMPTWKAIRCSYENGTLIPMNNYEVTLIEGENGQLGIDAYNFFVNNYVYEDYAPDIRSNIAVTINGEIYDTISYYDNTVRINTVSINEHNDVEYSELAYVLDSNGNVVKDM